MQRRDFLAAAAAALAAGCSTSLEPAQESSTTTAAPPPVDSSAPPTSAGDVVAETVDPLATAPQGIDFGQLPFPYGVASGDPDSTSVVLWTGLAPVSAALDVELAVDLALDEDFTTLVGSDAIVARLDDGFTTKHLATGLVPDTTYYYRFRVASSTSPTGRTRTLPVGQVEHFGLAASSCQSRVQPEFWDNHLRLAEDPDVDAVVWLGDFIYERRAKTLDQYRDRYIEARSDRRLQASSGAHPWFVIWDDHEVLNDYDASVDPDRRAAGYRAWWEFMPTRLPRPNSDALQIYRSVDVGSMLRLVLLDCRQYQTAETVLGSDQLSWLGETLDHDGQRTIVASSLIMSSLNLGERTPVYTFEAHPQEQAAIAELLINAPEPTIISGDLHIQMELQFAPGIEELMAPPLSSLFRREWVDLLPFLPFVSENVLSAEATHGYLRLDVTPDAVSHTFVTA